MSESRKERRARERETAKHFDYLGQLLMGFYTFLEQQEKPSNEQVRSEFVKRNENWKRYCRCHQLNERAALMFNNEVAISWEQRYAKRVDDNN